MLTSITESSDISSTSLSNQVHFKVMYALNNAHLPQSDMELRNSSSTEYHVVEDVIIESKKSFVEKVNIQNH